MSPAGFLEICPTCGASVDWDDESPHECSVSTAVTPLPGHMIDSMVKEFSRVIPNDLGELL